MNVPAFRSALFVGALFVALSVSTAGSAQTTRTIVPEAFSSDGSELFARTSVSGTSDSDETFSYTLIKAFGADGTLVGAYRGGPAEGPEQPAFVEAGTAQQARQHMQTSGTVDVAEGDTSPEGERRLVSMSRSMVVPAQTPDCPACRVCRTTYQVLLLDKAAEAAIVLDSGTRVSESVSMPGEPVCTQVSARMYWHPENSRAALVTSDRAGENRFETLTRLDTSNLSAYATHPIHRLPRVAPAGDMRAEFDTLVSSLSSAPDRMTVMTRLGDLAVSLGDYQTARDYFGIVQSSQESARIEFQLQFLNFLEGGERALRNMRRSAREADGSLDRELAVALYLAGELEDAIELMGTLDVDFAKSVFQHDYAAGLRAFNGATNGGRSATLEQQHLLVGELLAGGSVDEAATLVASLDQEEPTTFALALLIALGQDRAADVIREGESHLYDNPGNCLAHRAVGEAKRATGDWEGALISLRTAGFCDANEADAYFAIAGILWDSLEIRDASDAASSYLSLAGARANDDERTWRRWLARTMVDRERSPDLVLLSWNCSGSIYSGRSCTGEVLNRSEATVDASTVSLIARTSDGEMLDGVTISYGAIEAGARVEIEASLVPVERIEDPSEVEVVFNVTGPDTARSENQVSIGLGL